MPDITRIKKRDGRIAPFEQEKITDAIGKAFLATTGKRNDAAAGKVSGAVVLELGKRFGGNKVPGVENVQDMVEQELMKAGYGAVAKAYILYRKKHAELRTAKRFIAGVEDELKLSLNAMKVLEKRYLVKDEHGRVAETPSQMFRRVAKTVAAADKPYGGNVKEAEEEFYSAMSSLDFVPNSPTMMNAGTPLGQLSACFVLPVEDSLAGIFDTLKNMAIIHQSGGGTGFSFSHLRPKGDMVRSTHGVASGPVSFMSVYDATTNVIKQGGRRRGANMGILRVDHPDIIEFITCKTRENFLTNFNVSVAATDEFMKALSSNGEYWTVNPRTGKQVKKLKARDVFNLIVTMAWKTGDPGLVFIDEINRHNPTPLIGKIESTNPCGEVPLLPYESCNLGSINLARFVKDGKTDWERLRKTIRTAVHFLDNIIDANRYPLKETEKMTKGNRKIGLGVMGFAEYLILLGMPYDSEEALHAGEKVMTFVEKEGIETSKALAEKRGAFPNWKGSIWTEKMRNATVTTIAPTGTISIVAGCSSGIEPLFAVSFVRNVMEGTRLIEANPVFEKIARERGFYSEALMAEIAKTGSVQGRQDVPKDVKRLFVTALEIGPEWHVRMQAVFQRHSHNAVSKTINFPEGAQATDVGRAYLLAHKLKCKGITVYRYGSKKEQVLYIAPQVTEEKTETMQYVGADAEFAGGCPSPLCST